MKNNWGTCYHITASIILKNSIEFKGGWETKKLLYTDVEGFKKMTRYQLPSNRYLLLAWTFSTHFNALKKFLLYSKSSLAKQQRPSQVKKLWFMKSSTKKNSNAECTEIKCFCSRYKNKNKNLLLHLICTYMSVRICVYSQKIHCKLII